MSSETVMDFYGTLGFEEAEIEDGLDALLFELTPDGSYVLLTTEDGTIPDNLREAVIFACYTPEGAFLWSASFKNSYIFKDIWSEPPTPEDKLDAVRKHRENNEHYT